LGEFPGISLPALEEMIHSDTTEEDSKQEAIIALQRFGVRAYSEVPLLSNLLKVSETHLGLRDCETNAFLEIVGCVGKQTRDLNSLKLIAAWYHLRVAKQQLLSIDPDSQGTIIIAIDESLASLRAEAKHRGLLAGVYVGLFEASFAIISVILILFFPTQAKRLNRLIGQIETGPTMIVPMVGWEIRVPKLKIGKFLQCIFILGILLKLTSRSKRRLREWEKNNEKTRTIEYYI
jgi:hypothetical protein